MSAWTRGPGRPGDRHPASPTQHPHVPESRQAAAAAALCGLLCAVFTPTSGARRACEEVGTKEAGVGSSLAAMWRVRAGGATRINMRQGRRHAPACTRRP